METQENQPQERVHVQNHFRPAAPFSQTRTAEQKESKPKNISGVLDGIITACIALLFFGVPIFFTGLTFQGLAFEKQIFFYFVMLIALVAWTAKGVITGEMKIRRTPLDYPMIAFVVLYAISTFFSVDRWHSFWGFFGDPSRGLMSIIGLFIAYYIIVSHYTFKRFIRIIATLSVANFILGLWALLQIMGVHILSDKWAAIIPASTIGSLSGLGMFLGMMLPILTLLILHLRSEKSEAKKLFSTLSLVFLFVTMAIDIFLLLVLYSFVSWLSVLVGVSVFLVYVLARIVRPSESWAWVPMFAFVAILAILMIGNNTIARVSLPVEVSPAPSLSWSVAKESLKHAFLIGSGTASYGYDFSLYHPQSFNQESLYNLRFYQASGLFFEALSTIGILGTIVLVLIALTYIGSGVYLLSTDKAKNKLYSLGIFSAAAIALIGGFSQRVEGSMLILSVLIGALSVVVLLTESESEERFLSLSLKASPKYALALAFIFMVVSAGVVFLFVFIGKVFIADLKAGSGVREQQISENGSIAKIAQAINWYPQEGRYFTRLGQEYLVLANNEALKSQDQQDANKIRTYLQTAIMLAKQGRDIMPNDVLAQETLAQTYENAGLYVQDSLTLSQDAYKRAIELEPLNPIYPIKIGQLIIAQASSTGDKNALKTAASQAKDWLQKSVDLKQNLPDGYYQLSFADEILTDNDGAISAMEKAVANNNTNESYILNLARLYQLRGNDTDMSNAQAIYQQLIKNKDNDINAHFALGLFWEKKKDTSDATKEYQKVLSLLPDNSGETKTQIQKMISNIAAGIPNTPENVLPQSQQSAAQNPPLVQSGQ
jgi:cytochrome c-type biogenesis protein CcmH/NrfG